MKLQYVNNILNAAFNYVILTSKNYNIDESHSLKHSIEVFNYANKKGYNLCLKEFLDTGDFDLNKLLLPINNSLIQHCLQLI